MSRKAVGLETLAASQGATSSADLAAYLFMAGSAFRSMMPAVFKRWTRSHASKLSPLVSAPVSAPEEELQRGGSSSSLSTTSCRHCALSPVDGNPGKMDAVKGRKHPSAC